MVSVDRHEQLELSLGRGCLDRLTDDSYALAMSGNNFAPEFDAEMCEINDALVYWLERGVVEFVDYCLSPRNPLRFISTWRAVNASDDAGEL